MTTTYGTDAQVQAQGKKLAKKRNRKLGTIGAGVAVLLASGGAAWAAMTIFGEGDATATAYQAKNLTVLQSTIAPDLYPGSESDLVMRIKNENPFPVKIQKIEAVGAPTAITPGCDITKLTGPMGSNPSYTIPTGSQPTVSGGATNQTVTIPKVVKLDLEATQGCGFKLAFKITAVQSAANNG